MKSRLTFTLDVNNVKEVGPYYTPRWDLFVNEGYVGEFWGWNNRDMVARFLGRNRREIVRNVIQRLQQTPKYSYA